MKVRDIIMKNKEVGAVDIYSRNGIDEFQSFLGTLYKGESESHLSKALELRVLEWKNFGKCMVVYALQEA